MNYNYRGANNQGTSSPLKKSITYQSPVKQVQTLEEADLWKTRCQDLEENLFQLNSDLEIANFKAKKAVELEDKVDKVLEHNGQLLSENDQLQKSLQQKRTETDVWKTKYEQQMNSVIGMKATYELEIKKLNQELLKEREYSNLQILEKQREIEQLRQRSEIENSTQFNNLRRSHGDNIQIYEEQLKKQRDIIEAQSNEINLLNSKLREQRTDEDLQVARLAEDREKLLMKMSQYELENQREKEFSKSLLNKQHQDALNNQKQHFKNELSVLESEIIKLKNLIDLKNNEIDNLIDQNKKHKQNHEDEQGILRLEILELKDQIQQNNLQHQDEIDRLKDRLLEQHSNDLHGLKFAHENQIEQLSSEIESLNAIIITKEHEIEEQVKQKLQQRENYTDEVDRLNKEIEIWRIKTSQTERQREKDVFEKQRQVETMDLNHREYIRKSEDKIRTLQLEIQDLQQLLKDRTNDLEESSRQYRIIREALEDDNKNLQLNVRHLEEQLIELKNLSKLDYEQLKSNLLQDIEQLRSEKINLEKSALKHLEEIQRLKETIETKKEENKNGNQLRGLQEQEIKKLNIEKQQLQEEIIYIERIKNKELEDLHLKLDEHHNYAIQNIQKTYQNQVNMLQVDIQDLQYRIELKDRELVKYIEKYEKIENIIKDFLNHPEKLKDRAEVVTIKNLYESLKGTKSKSPSKSPTKRYN